MKFKIQSFKDISIKRKLITIILTTSAFVLLLTSSAFVTNEVFMLRRSMVEELFTTADIIGSNSSGSILFLDEKTAEENISALKANPQIMTAHIFLTTGEIFASYYLDDVEIDADQDKVLHDFYSQHVNTIIENAEIPVEVIEDDAHFFKAQFLEVFKPIVFDDEAIGTIYIKSNLNELNNRLMWEAIIISIAMFSSLVLVFFMSGRLQATITTPLFSLLRTMKIVSAKKDYSIREVKSTRDEIGTLVDGFNDMLAQIEIQTEELNQYHNHLEEKVTQRTKELAEARDQALAANRAKSVFLANMSHEIRTPMNAVLGYAQILQRDTTLTKEQKESLRIIESSGNHLLGLINDILDISKIEAGAMELHPENFYLYDLIDAIAAMFKVRCEQKHLGWRVENSIEGQPVVSGDQGKIRQMLINLLGNAVKFTEKGEVFLRVASVKKKKDHYRFDIIDTGRGISQEDQQNIFEPFQQEKSGFDKGGTGLGLAITKRQVELMGGNVNLVSDLGMGSCFTIVLPLPESVGEVIAKPTSYQNVNHLKSHCRIDALVVDDVKENRDILSHMLSQIGVEVRTASYGQLCLDSMHESLPDIVFMDIRMPVMDGMAAIKQIQIDFPDKKIPCVAISASTLHHEAQAMSDAGFNDVIAKPFKFEEVYDCLAKYNNAEFEYKSEDEDAQIEEQEMKIDITSLSLSKTLYTRLEEAAELNELTEIEEILLELREGDEGEVALAEVFQEFLDNYDIEGILETLQKVSYV